MTKLTTALAALAAASTLAPAALADTAGISNRDITVSVKSTDLDLNSLSDAKLLLTRIEDAAKEACFDPRSAIRNMEHRCRAKIVESNVERLNIETLKIAFNDAYGQKLALAR